jgi:hypothetical protein
MAIHFNHTILSAHDSKASAAFLFCWPPSQGVSPRGSTSVRPCRHVADPTRLGRHESFGQNRDLQRRSERCIYARKIPFARGAQWVLASDP